MDNKETDRAGEDPNIWLEAIDDEQCLDWVRQRNATTMNYLTELPGYQDRKAEALKILTSKDRIQYGVRHGDFVYNFWRDADNPQGLWRRTTPERFHSGEYEWEVLLDLDQLSENEGKHWVWGGSEYLRPTNDRMLIQLSDGGKDAAVVREYDVEKRSFINPQEGGFALPEAKSNYTWENRNSLLLATDWGEDSLTESGYPRILKRLMREQSLETAQEICRVDPSHVSVHPFQFLDGDRQVLCVVDALTFFEFRYYILLEKDGSENKVPVLLELPVPRKCRFSAVYEGQVVLFLQEDWNHGEKTYHSGSLVSFNLDGFLNAGEIGEVSVIFESKSRIAVENVARCKSALLVNLNDNVISVLKKYTLSNGQWSSETVAIPDHGNVAMIAPNSDSDSVYLNFSSFLVSSSLMHYEALSNDISVLQTLPEKFCADGMVVDQNEAISSDGTKVPYFVVHKSDMPLDGSSSTLLYGYGGFEVTMSPFYLNTYGKLWVEQGGVFVLANIRGGGEFGPVWHQAALKLNRQRAFDDFHAIAEDLIKRQITNPERLGIAGGSNGGLLVGVAFTQRPDLYQAVVCQVPLLDMLRYHELPPGASWIGEYGDPRIPEERAYIATYSPYQQLKPASEIKYPRVYFYTSTKDDRVHPGHARKMVARMEQLGHPCLYFERIEGGHGGGANLDQHAESYALEFTYLWNELSDTD